MKKITLHVFLILQFFSVSFAKTTEELRAQHVLSKIQEDYISCYAFYKIGTDSFENLNDVKKDIIEGLKQSGETSLKLAYETGELMSMNVEDMKTKVISEMKLQIVEIKNDYKNFSILLDKYAFLCKNLIENKKHYIFGRDGGKNLSQAENIPLLAELPLDQSIREAGDVGRPAALQNSLLSNVFSNLAREVQNQICERKKHLPPTKKVKITHNRGCN